MLLRHYYCTGEAPVDSDEELWRLAKCDNLDEWLAVRPKLERLFYIFHGIWVHDRVEETLAEALNLTERRSVAGYYGGKARHAISPSEPHPKLEPSGATHQDQLPQVETQQLYTQEPRSPTVTVLDMSIPTGDDHMWEVLVERFYKTGKWATELRGPPPGQEGCKVPVDILVRAGYVEFSEQQES
jgi:uncharacterized protein YdaU (DUF1376 family)